MKIILLCLIMLAAASITNMVAILSTQHILLNRIKRVERNYKHLLHRINAIEYPEVLEGDKKDG